MSREPRHPAGAWGYAVPERRSAVKSTLYLGGWFAWVASVFVNVWDNYQRVHGYADQLRGMGLPMWLSELFPPLLLVVTSLWIIAIAHLSARDKIAAANVKTQEAKDREGVACDKCEALERDITALHFIMRGQGVSAEVRHPPINQLAEVLRERKRAIEATGTNLANLQIEQEKVIRILNQPNSAWTRAPKGWGQGAAWGLGQLESRLLREWAGLYAVMMHRYPGQITPHRDIAQGDIELARKASAECVGLVIREIEYPDWPSDRPEKIDTYIKGWNLEFPYPS
ncbi:MAG: hypothetical protein ACKVU4_12280 [Phycisphaerales bacterium]